MVDYLDTLDPVDFEHSEPYGVQRRVTGALEGVLGPLPQPVVRLGELTARDELLVDDTLDVGRWRGHDGDSPSVHVTLGSRL